MSKYTEGEWYKESGDDDTFGYGVYYIHANGGKMVCEGICNPHDACLLESSKETLEALEAMMQCHRKPHDKEGVKAWNNATSAIKKARGEL